MNYGKPRPDPTGPDPTRPEEASYIKLPALTSPFPGEPGPLARPSTLGVAPVTSFCPEQVEEEAL